MRRVLFVAVMAALLVLLLLLKSGYWRAERKTPGRSAEPRGTVPQSPPASHRQPTQLPDPVDLGTVDLDRDVHGIVLEKDGGAIAACQQTVEWLKRFPDHRGIQVSVNISEKQLVSPELLPELDRIVEETGVKPASVGLELKVSLLVDAPESMAVLWQLRKRGFRLQIDNFGTGYTSLRELYRSPVETLKIDRSFIARMKPGGEDAEVVRAIAALGDGLGLAVVAEGVETSDQLAQVRELGLPLAQGYLFSRPLPSGEATALIAEDPKW